MKKPGIMSGQKHAQRGANFESRSRLVTIYGRWDASEASVLLFGMLGSLDLGLGRDGGRECAEAAVIDFG